MQQPKVFSTYKFIHYPYNLTGKYRLLIGLVMIALLAVTATPVSGQRNSDGYRDFHYQPRGTSFVRQSGTRRFNRALYGTHTAFRVEGGDLPEFALYMPGMGGNIRLLLQKNRQGSINENNQQRQPEAIWLQNADSIETIFDAGHLRYIIRDRLLGNGQLQLDLYALADADGAILSVTASHLAQPENYAVAVVYGGANGDLFSRGGDIGADPESSFYFRPDRCQTNQYHLFKNGDFILRYTTAKKKAGTEMIAGCFPPQAMLSVIDGTLIAQEAIRQSSDQLQTITRAVTPALLRVLRQPLLRGEQAPPLASPALLASFPLYNQKAQYCMWRRPEKTSAGYLPDALKHPSPALVFQRAKQAAERLASRIEITTPDPYVNTLGGVLSAAADAIWEAPTYLHGAVAWRMRLPAWRGPYAADALGWHDRAALHFSSYARSQVKSPASGPVIFDSSQHHARQLEKMGTSMFSAGYICRNPDGDFRPHHYDMNLVFIDQLLEHFNYTGDTAYLRRMWPVIALSLQWENRNFDPDGDGLYDAYACIWASDALEYNGGSVTHSTAYNYRANRLAARLAEQLGMDGSPYRQKARQIKNAVNRQLWLPFSGVYAEYKDRFGARNIHPSPGLWTLYHSIESGLPDPFQAYQVTAYADRAIPHIPVRVRGLRGVAAKNTAIDTSLFLLSTTNWQPYTWSVNNVALAENLNMALGYWLAGRSEAGFHLWKSALLESMFLGPSPGGFEQLSSYDARRGALYRDFADPVGVAARSLMEGLFGLRPMAMKDTLQIQPGLPQKWQHAALRSPDADFSFQREDRQSIYHIRPHYPKKMALQLRLKIYTDGVKKVMVNGRQVPFRYLPAIGQPLLELNLPPEAHYDIIITWSDKPLPAARILPVRTTRKAPHQSPGDTTLMRIILRPDNGKILGIKDPQQRLRHSQSLPDGQWQIEDRHDHQAGPAGTIFIHLHSARSRMDWWQPAKLALQPVQNESHWFTAKIKSCRPVKINRWFNDQVTNIFKHSYMSPRAASVSLQLPLQGIGNWCYPKIQPDINDHGLRKKAGKEDQLLIGDSLRFSTPHTPHQKNVVFTSEWDNYPAAVTLPLQGQAAGIALLMTGTTNPMQSQMENGVLLIEYEDHTTEKIALSNPETWWPIEQDYYNDGKAFQLKRPPPVRIHLKTGQVFDGFAPDSSYQRMKGFSDRMIDGGAASIYQYQLDPGKKLKSVTVRATAQEVIIGLMGISLLNPVPENSSP